MIYTELPYGPTALLFKVPEQPNSALTQRLVFVAHQLNALPFVQEARISYNEILVVAKLKDQFNLIRSEVEILFNEVLNYDYLEGRRKEHEILVSYAGVDMKYVIESTGLSRQEVIQLHTHNSYTVHALGFQPGFAFLGSLPEQLQLPRRAVPRKIVPTNSVAIAADQTSIYPHASPGGWHLIGIAQQPVFDHTAEKLSIFQPGDTVQFIDADQQ